MELKRDSVAWSWRSRSGSILFLLLVHLCLDVILKTFIHYSVFENKRLLGLIRTFLMFNFYVIWGISLQHRITQTQVKIFLLIMQRTLLFWIIVRSIKYYYVTDYEPILMRYLWFAYYLPIFCLPCLFFLIALSLDKPDDFKLDRKVFWLAAAFGLFFLLLMTNDLHQWVFKMPDTKPWLDQAAGYQPLFYIMMFAVMLLAMVSLVIFFKHNIRNLNRRYVLLIFIVFLGVLAYLVFDLSQIEALRVLTSDMTVFHTFSTTIIVELLIHGGFIRSNTYYREVFEQVSMPLAIADESGNILYQSNEMPEITPRELDLAARESVLLDEDHRLLSSPLSKGRVFWIEDLSIINYLLMELRVTKERLAQNNKILRTDVELQKQYQKIKTQASIYERVSREIAEPVLQLESILHDEDPSISLENKVMSCAMLGAYIKRRSNLIILTDGERMLNAMELEFSLRESIECAKDCGVSIYFNRKTEGFLASQAVLKAYESFNELLLFLCYLRVPVLVNFYRQEQAIYLKVQSDADLFTEDMIEQGNFQQDWDIEVNDETIFFSLKPMEVLS